jgi:hypothetical protein
MKVIPFIATIKYVKYLRINFTEDVKDHYDKNYKTLKEMGENTKLESHSVFIRGIRGINIVKMFMLPEVIYRFDAITNKIYQ